MPQFFRGIRIESCKSHACVADETGAILGFGTAGAGNHESVGYDGMIRALDDATRNALWGTGISRRKLAGAGFDSHTEHAAMLKPSAPSDWKRLSLW